MAGYHCSAFSDFDDAVYSYLMRHKLLLSSPDPVLRIAQDNIINRLGLKDDKKRHLRLGPDEPDEVDTEGDVLTAPAEPKLKKPPMYKVIILNDDFTPMEFVVHILESFFVLSREKATQIMLSIHTTGSGVAGIFPRDIAETKSEQVNQYAQENNHPLMSTVEMTD